MERAPILRDRSLVPIGAEQGHKHDRRSTLPRTSPTNRGEPKPETRRRPYCAATPAKGPVVDRNDAEDRQKNDKDIRTEARCPLQTCILALC